MENFIVALNVVLPLCFLILIGYIVKKIEMVDAQTFKKINKLVSKVLIPCVLMKNIMEPNLSTDMDIRFVGYGVFSLLFVTLLAWMIVPLFEKNKKRIGVIIQGCYRSNFVLFGLTLVANLYGSENTAITSVLISFCVPVINIIAIVVLQYFGMDEVDSKAIVKELCKNPIIIGALLGFAILLLKIDLYPFLDTTIGDLSKMATPLALIILGGTLELKEVRKNLKGLTLMTLGKLVIVPGLMTSIGAMLGYRGIHLMSLLALFGSPIAVSSYPMATEMHCDDELASQGIVVTTVLSIFTMVFWIFVFKTFNLL